MQFPNYGLCNIETDGSLIKSGSLPNLTKSTESTESLEKPTLILVLSLETYVTLARYFVSLNLFIFKIKKLDWKMSKALLSVREHLLRSQVAYQHMVKSIHVISIISAVRFDT